MVILPDEELLKSIGTPAQGCTGSRLTSMSLIIQTVCKFHEPPVAPVHPKYTSGSPPKIEATKSSV